MVGIQQLRADVIAASQILDMLGLTQGYGHVSARIPGTDTFIATARQGLGLVRSEKDLVVLNLEGQLVEGEGPPPLEVNMHTAVYKSRPDAAAICRTHAESANVFSVLGKPLRPVHGFGSLLGPEVPVCLVPYLITDDDLASEMMRSLGQARAVILRGNGNVVLGGSVEEACILAIFLEASARIQRKAAALGTPLYFTAEEVERRNEVPYDHIGRAWQYYKDRAMGRELSG